MLYWTLLILLIAVVIGLDAHHTHALVYIHSFILLLVMVVISGAIFLALFYTAIRLELHFNFVHANSVFSLILLLAVVIGLLMARFLRWFQGHFHYSVTTLTMMEYYIQWTLIYVTVYQVLFDNLFQSSKEFVNLISKGTIVDPKYLILALFPALMSTWIGIALYKVRQKIM